MPQDQASGAAARKWGLRMARDVAPRIGVTLLGLSSNEGTLDGEPVVIKCARRRTNTVGVYLGMLDRLAHVIAAFENDKGSFDIYRLDQDAFRQGMRIVSGKGMGEKGLVGRGRFEKHGERLR